MQNAASFGVIVLFVHDITDVPLACTKQDYVTLLISISDEVPRGYTL